MTDDPPRFIADCMLGKLARRLRILGFDAAYERRIADDALIERAREEGRVLLTRDTRLVKRRGLPPHLLVASPSARAQVTQTLAALGLRADPARVLTRCLECNVETRVAARDDVRDEVPPYVLATQERFRRCPGCGRIYWRATHVAGMIEEVLKAAGLDAGAAGGGEGPSR